MKRNHLRIVIARHAFERALRRGIPPDLLFNAVKTGKLKAMGKNRARIEKEFRKFTLVCVDEFSGNTLLIVTVEKRLRK